MKPKLLDLFSGAGGAGMGYHLAGFEVVGIDEKAMPRYPFEFQRGDALAALADAGFMAQFAAVHASPPCKTQTSLKAFSGRQHLNLIPQTRELLDATGLPYVIENVPGAHLHDPVILCGSMFDLGVRRHREFELGRWKSEQPACRHAEQDAASPMYQVKRYHSGKPVITPSPVIGVYGRGQGLGKGEVEMWKRAMGINWMIRDELSQAIPPAYTAHLGRQLLAHLAVGASA